MLMRGWLYSQTERASDAVRTIATGITALRTGATTWITFWLAFLAKAYADLGQFDDAWRRISEAMTTMETIKENGTKPRSIA